MADGYREGSKKKKPINPSGRFPKLADVDQYFLEKVKIWTSFYRQFPYKFVEDYFGIYLKPFQKILLYCMMHYNFFMFIASRGLGKTWLTAIFCLCRAILYPNTKIIVSSGNRGQALEIINYINEFRKNSECVDKEISYLSDSLNGACVDFANGSWLRVVTANDGARSKRANLLILDEFRQIDKGILDTVLRKFKANPRQAGYLRKPEYSHLAERNIEIYMSSAYYKHNWGYTKFKAFFKSMMNGQPYFLCDLPYQLSIESNLRLADEVRDEMSEEDFDPIAWKMEMEGVWIGENEKAFYKYDLLEPCRTLNKCIYPSELEEVISKKDNKMKNRKKQDGEIRIVFVDIAMMGGKENDASSMGCLSLIPTKSYFERHVSYIETLNGVHTEKQALRIRQLYEDFNADYIVIDTQNAGTSIFDLLCQPLYDKEKNIEYQPLNCSNDERLSERCVYPNAQKVIFSIRASGQFNSDIAYALKDAIVRKKFKILINENEAKEIVSKIQGYAKFPNDLQAKLLLPYLQTTALVNEMINLEGVINDQTGILKLKEPRSGRKDRYVSVAYANYFANILEKELFKPKKKRKSVASTFQFRQPQIRS